jgi:hypothetical protein
MTARTSKARRYERQRIEDSEAEVRILETHARQAKGPSGTAIVPELRRALPDIPCTTFDRCLHRLWREGILLLGKAVYLEELRQDDREACLTNHEGTPLLYVSRGSP